MRVYADSASTMPMRECALDEYIKTAKKTYGNASTIYHEGICAKQTLDCCREEIASIFHCFPDEIIFTSGGSESNNQVFNSIMKHSNVVHRRKVFISAIEHPSVLYPALELKNYGFDVSIIPVNSDGFVNVDEIEYLLDDETILLSVMMINNEIGTIQPIEDIVKICSAKNILFHTDAVQAIGLLPINLQNLLVDYMSLSAHKFGGPKGIGLLFARRGTPLYSFIIGGDQERKKRAGTENIPAIASMTVALKEAVDNLKEKNIYLKQLRDKLIDNLSAIPHSQLNGGRLNRSVNNVNFCFESCKNQQLLMILDRMGISVSSGSACKNINNNSHVLLAIGRNEKLVETAIRITINEYTTEEDIDYIIYCIKNAVEQVRASSSDWRDIKLGKKKHMI